MSNISPAESEANSLSYLRYFSKISQVYCAVTTLSSLLVVSIISEYALETIFVYFIPVLLLDFIKVVKGAVDITLVPEMNAAYEVAICWNHFRSSLG